MFQLDLPLLSFLHARRTPVAYFYLGNELPPLAELLPEPNVSFESVDKERDWQPRWPDAAFWDDRQNFLRVKQSNATAVFDAPFRSIPPAAFEVLRGYGFRSLLFRVGSEWRETRLDNRGPLFLLQTGNRMAEFVRRSALKYKKRRRAKLLDSRAVNIASIAGSPVKHESQNAFTCYLPDLQPFADSGSGNGTGILFFEEESLLLPHASHSDIRELGRGRISLWNDNFYFSSSDNSDPRSNGRRYRYLLGDINDENLRKQLRTLSSDLSELNGNPRSDNSESKGEVLLSIGSRRLDLASPLRFEQSVTKEPGSTYEPRSDSSVELFITNLGPGGAERQMTGLAVRLKQLNVAVHVSTYRQSAVETLHYKPMLEQNGIGVDFMSEEHPKFTLRDCVRERGFRDLELIASLPVELADEVWKFYTHLFVNRPAVLHCWLDQSNLVGAIAGWIAGVPKIVISSRSVNPSHFPHIYRPWYRKWYDIVSRSSRVQWSANSEVGAASYAEWIGIDPARFHLVPNGVDFDAIKAPPENEVAAFRNQLGIPSESPVICGVLRLSHEKRPLRFVRLIWEARKRHPNLHAILVGMGPLQAQVQREIDNLKLADCLHLVGRRDDVPLMMRASDLVVLTSSVEAFPNVLIEAQWLSRPVVSTEVGSVRAVVDDGVTGFICDRDRFADLLDRTLLLLGDAERRVQFGRAGKTKVESLYSMDRMTEQYLELYGIRFSQEDLQQVCA